MCLYRERVEIRELHPLFENEGAGLVTECRVMLASDGSVILPNTRCRCVSSTNL